jgi:hypothetical protein
MRLGSAVDLGARDADVGTYKLLRDLDDFANGDALDVHFGQCQVDRLLASVTTLQKAGIGSNG